MAKAADSDFSVDKVEMPADKIAVQVHQEQLCMGEIAFHLLPRYRVNEPAFSDSELIEQRDKFVDKPPIIRPAAVLFDRNPTSEPLCFMYSNACVRLDVFVNSVQPPPEIDNKREADVVRYDASTIFDGRRRVLQPGSVSERHSIRIFVQNGFVRPENDFVRQKALQFSLDNDHNPSMESASEHPPVHA